MDMRLFGVCGLYCGACTHYRSTQKDGKHLLNEYVRQGGEAEKFVCGGCQSGQLNPHLACSSCGIRDCVEERGITCCGHCDEYPCPYLITFQNDSRVHHLDILDNMKDIMEMGSEKWLKTQDEQWTCPSCGTSYTWYETTCHRCGDPLESYGSTRKIR
ncbi:MAG: DUF3795 domain-containing protein [Atribacterota bacterium]